jgi:hypothetical protein
VNTDMPDMSLGMMLQHVHLVPVNVEAVLVLPALTEQLLTRSGDEKAEPPP